MKTYEVYGRVMKEGRINSTLLGTVEEKATIAEERAAAIELLKKNGFVWGGWESRAGWQRLDAVSFDDTVKQMAKGAIYFEG